MDNILVDIYVPVISKSYQFFIPSKVVLKKLLPHIERIVQELSFDAYLPSGEAVLCKKTDGEVLDNSRTSQNLGLENGSSLILI